MTDVALRDYLERLIAESDRRYEQRFEAMDAALSKAEVALREYKAGSNEWRDALKDQAQRLATREELRRIDEAVQELQRSKANFDGRLLVVSAVTSIIVSGIVGLIVRMLL